jgi:hypothetical protein
VLGVRATGWFLSPILMATVEHVTAAMQLSDRDWKHVEIGKGESKQSIPSRRFLRVQDRPGRVADSICRRTGLFSPDGVSRSRAARRKPRLSRRRPACRKRSPSCSTATTAVSQARRCSKCTTETTALCSITVPRERRYSSALAKSSRSSATCSQRACSSCHARSESRRPGDIPMSFPCLLFQC